MAIIAARRQLLKLAHDMQNGKDPYPAFHGDLYHVRPIDVVSSEADFDKVLTANMDKAAALV